VGNKKDIIRRIIEKVIGYRKEMLLFGSLAQKTNRIDSDFDIFVIVDVNGIARRKIIEMGAEIRRRCAKRGIDVDIIVSDKNYVQEMKKFPGNTVYEALSYGAPI